MFKLSHAKKEDNREGKYIVFDKEEEDRKENIWMN